MKGLDRWRATNDKEHSEFGTGSTFACVWMKILSIRPNKWLKELAAFSPGGSLLPAVFSAPVCDILDSTLAKLSRLVPLSICRLHISFLLHY